VHLTRLQVPCTKAMGHLAALPTLSLRGQGGANVLTNAPMTMPIGSAHRHVMLDYLTVSAHALASVTRDACHACIQMHCAWLPFLDLRGSMKCTIPCVSLLQYASLC
jgi:hypothetical protein